MDVVTTENKMSRDGYRLRLNANANRRRGGWSALSFLYQQVSVREVMAHHRRLGRQWRCGQSGSIGGPVIGQMIVSGFNCCAFHLLSEASCVVG